MILGYETPETTLYRYNTDKRVAHSASQLFKAIQALLQEKEFDDIGIKELSERAGVGRATFYRNFNYIEDVLRYKLDLCFEDCKQLIQQQSPQRGADDLRFLLKYWSQQAAFLQLLVTAERWQLFQQGFRNGSEIRMLEISAEHNLNQAQQQYLHSILIAQVSAVLQTWIERGQLESADELANFFEIPYRIYLLQQANNQ